MMTLADAGMMLFLARASRRYKRSSYYRLMVERERPKPLNPARAVIRRG